MDGLFVEMNEREVKSAAHVGELPAWLEIVRRQVGSLHHGVAQIVVHNSQVTQIDKTERVRLEERSGRNHIEPTRRLEA